MFFHFDPLLPDIVKFALERLRSDQVPGVEVWDEKERGWKEKAEAFRKDNLVRWTLVYFRLGLLTIDPPFSPIQQRHDLELKPKAQPKKKSLAARRKRKNEQDALQKMDTANLVNFIESDRKKKKKKRKKQKSEDLENIIEGEPFHPEASGYDLVERVQLVPLYNNFIQESDEEEEEELRLFRESLEGQPLSGWKLRPRVSKLWRQAVRLIP